MVEPVMLKQMRLAVAVLLAAAAFSETNLAYMFHLPRRESCRGSGVT